jgi:hypothetical protein
MKDWCFSLFLISVYLATFLLWQQFPSRAGFLFGGLASATVMAAGLIWAFKRKYFVDKADLFFHGCVILDVIIEGALYEAARFAGYVAAGETELLFSLHNGNNFYGCAAAFTLVIGFHRWRIMRANRK